ncbi:MAG: CocE/NonD family hydrolase [Thermoplasmatales archaeon]|nr:MAG: CocE/NonD family hydrolase [Thermoplasmatales archaeon]
MKHKKIIFISIILIILLALLSGCVQKSTYMIPMRDGIKLATDVYLPSKNPEAHGAILLRTPYNKDLLFLAGRNWARSGWPIIIQDMRGRFNSEGEDVVYQNDHTDGPDTLEWIVNQTWSNGKVATFGGSALGICQYYMAGANPPELACQYIQVATPNLHKHAIYQGGQFRYNLVYRWLENQGSLNVLPELYENENYTLEVWTNVSLEDNWQDINVPAVHIGGWYDCFCQGTVDGFMGYQYLGGEGARGKSKLIMGPWTHGGAGKVKQGELIYPNNSVNNFSSGLFFDMINEFTMGQQGNFDEWPPVYYYVMGDVNDTNAPGNEWRSGEDWPPAHIDTNWYLHENGLLSRTYPSEYESMNYNYDPTNPVPTKGGQNLNLPPGPHDQSSVEDRDDVLVFTSDVLTEPYEATGPIKARLYVSSDCPDTDFTVKLTDVYPDGRSMLITDGILRMRNRNGSDHWEFMEADEIYEIEVDLWSTSYIWNTGHRIRIAVSSSNYPRFLNNPNTDNPIAKNTTYNIAQNTIYLDSEHPSSIIVPEIDEKLINSKNKIINYDDDSNILKDILNSRLRKFLENLIKSHTNQILDPFFSYESEI